MKKILLSLIALSSFTSVLAHADAEAQKCADRVQAAGCELSNNDFKRIDKFVETCKHFESEGRTLEAFLVKDLVKMEKYKVIAAGIEYIDIEGDELFVLVVQKTTTNRNQNKLVTVDLTEGSSTKCNRVKYTIDSAGIDTLKEIQMKGSAPDLLWMNSFDGQVYVMSINQNAYEVLDDNGGHYTSITRVGGHENKRTREMEVALYNTDRKGAQAVSTIGAAKLKSKIEQEEFRKLDFIKVPTERSLFRPE